jgi:uncharacterized protein (DUF608 family)
MKRRGFLQTVALGGSLGAQTSKRGAATSSPRDTPPEPGYPRVFTGKQLAMIAFPLGGVAAGSISLGGRGQLRDWEIFNKPDKGRAPNYGFTSIWAQAGSAKPVASVLESRYAPPYQAARGLGPQNAPGLRRLESATFTGEYPLAKIEFADSRLPVKVALEAFTPFIPLDAEESGLPVAILRYKVFNPGREKARVSIAFSLDNPVGATVRQATDARTSEYRKDADLEGLFMTNPGLPKGGLNVGSFAACFRNVGSGKITFLRGWPRAKWLTSPLLFWDDFSADGELGPEAEQRDAVGSICLQREIAPGAEAVYELLLSWHFPNRTPAVCGWVAPPGEENTIIGNHYSTRFADAWQAAAYAGRNLPGLEGRMRDFLAAIRKTTVPPVVKEAAMANLSTLATTTCFRTADGKFRGFEGSDDQRGCCFGTCTHVWNYESATNFLFPTLARSVREAVFSLADRMNGVLPIRLELPEGKQTTGVTAADGAMGQIMKAYLDWRLSGDQDWLRMMWPKVKKALEFAWVPGGWDANRDGVMEGVQHNTYDVEFYGPNPMCGIYYLGALRAGEEMARAMGDSKSADEYRRLFAQGSAWIDANLFNGEYYVQKIRPMQGDKIAQSVRSPMGADDPEHPDFQVGEGCLVDQLVGQYVADFTGLGPLVSPANMRKTLESIYKYNYKRSLFDHDSVERIYALNDEAAMVICDYAKAQRPKSPFPYFAEAWTGLEYSTATLMLLNGMVKEGVECIANVRRRYDGERRNPWDEAECGHHYARAMAAWSGILALSGFRYHAAEKSIVVEPKISPGKFASFWSTGGGWGTFSQVEENGHTRFSLSVRFGKLEFRTVELAAVTVGTTPAAKVESQSAPYEVRKTDKNGATLVFSRLMQLGEGDELRVTLG